MSTIVYKEENKLVPTNSSGDNSDLQVAYFTSEVEMKHAQECLPSTQFKDQAKSLGLALLQEAKDSQLNNIVGLICKGAPFISDLRGTSPLHWAAYNNSSTITELLLNSGIHCDQKNRVNRTPLHLAAQRGHSSIIKILLSHDADSSALDMLEMTPLHWAVESGDIESVKCLLFCGTKVNKNKFGKTPISIAESKGFIEIATLLKKAQDIELLLKDKFTSNFVVAKTEPDPDFGTTMKNIMEVGDKLELPKLENNENSTEADRNDPMPSSSLGDDCTLNLLKEHGIQMIDTGEGTGSLVTSAIESGQQIILTEAGKLALDTTSANDQFNNSDSCVKSGIKRPSDSKFEIVDHHPQKRVANRNALLTGQRLVKIDSAKLFYKNSSEIHMVEAIKTKKHFHIFEGKVYSKNEEKLLIEKVKNKIKQYRHHGHTLDMIARKKFLEANKLQDQLLIFLKKTKRFGDINKL